MEIHNGDMVAHKLDKREILVVDEQETNSYRFEGVYLSVVGEYRTRQFSTFEVEKPGRGA